MNADDDLTAELRRLTAAALGQEPGSGLAAGTGGVSHTLTVARTFAEVDVLPEEETRLVGAKRMIMRISRLFMHRQSAYNVLLVNAVSELNRELTALRSRTSNDMDRLAVLLATIEAENAELRDRLAHLEPSGPPAGGGDALGTGAAS